MADVMLSVGGRRYKVGCRAGEEAHVLRLAAALDAKAEEAAAALGHVTEARLLLMAGLLLADDQAGAAEPVLVDIAGRLEALAGKLERALAPGPARP